MYMLSIKLSIPFSGHREGRAISLLNENDWLTIELLIISKTI